MTKKQLIDFAWIRICAHYAKLYFPHKYKTGNLSDKNRQILIQVKACFDHFFKTLPKEDFEHYYFCHLAACDDLENSFLPRNPKSKPPIEEEWRNLMVQTRSLFNFREIP